MSQIRSMRMQRAEVSKATKALRDVAERRTGWQFDPRTGDAYMSIRPLVGTDPRVGCIAHVRANPEENAETVYESIVTHGGYSQWPGGHDDPTEALKVVETWLQRNLMGIAASKAAGDTQAGFRRFLVSHLGEEKGEAMFLDYIVYLTKGK